MQFAKLDYEILSNEELELKDKVIYSVLCDRMQSSVKRDYFYDEEIKAYYVIYTIEELSKVVKLAKGTVVDACKHLVELGYIVKKRQFSSATKIFLPKFNSEEYVKENTDDNTIPKIETSEVQYSESNHNTKHTNKHKTHKTPDNDYFDAISNSLIEKGGLSEHAVNMLKVYSFNDPKLLYNYASMIFKAKKRVSNEHKDVKDIISGTTLETNPELNSKLPKAIKQIIVTANHKAKNKNGYIYSALHNFFEECVDSYLQSKRKKTSNPIIESLV